MKRWGPGWSLVWTGPSSTPGLHRDTRWTGPSSTLGLHRDTRQTTSRHRLITLGMMEVMPVACTSASRWQGGAWRCRSGATIKCSLPGTPGDTGNAGILEMFRFLVIIRLGLRVGVHCEGRPRQLKALESRSARVFRQTVSPLVTVGDHRESRLLARDSRGEQAYSAYGLDVTAMAVLG